MVYKLLLLGAAGALGTVSRYGCAVFVERKLPGLFPWHTLAVNMAGCFLFGLVVAVLESRAHWPADVRVIVLTGFMGAFTTFSTFAFESAGLIRESQWALATANVALQNVVGIVFVFVGFALGKLI